MAEEKTSNRERLQKLGNDILTVSKNELLVSMRFLELAFPMLKNQMNMSTFLIGTDGESLYYQPRFLGERYAYDRILVNRAYLHLLFHCLFGHVYKEKDLEGEDLEEELWNFSCDLVCEYLIDQMEVPAVKRLVDERRESWYQMLEATFPMISAEGVYHYLKKNPHMAADIVSASLLFLVDDHSFWQEKSKKNDSSAKQKEEERKQEAKWSELSEKMETGMETYYRSVGDKAGSLLRHLKIRNHKKQDYRSFLRKFASVREEIKVDMDSFDYGFYHYGMQLYGNMPLIEELEYKEQARIHEFVIAIDTSGSCSGETVKQFVERTFAILTNLELFGNAMDVYLIQCDNEIKDVRHLTSKRQLTELMKDYEIKGHGGTDFRPVFSYIEELRSSKVLKNLKGLIYFTDGYGIYPKKKTAYQTAFIFPGGDYLDTEVPPWAMKLILEE